MSFFWRAVSITISVLFVGSASSPLRAQPPDLMALWQQTERHYVLGRYADAEASARTSIERARARFGGQSPAISRGYHDLSRVFWRIGKSREAEVLSRQSLAIRERAFGITSPQASASLAMLGLIHLVRYETGPAEEFLTKAVSNLERGAALAPFQRGNTLRLLGGVYARQGKLRQAESALRQALILQEKAVGPDSIWSLRIRSNLANVLFLLGKSSDAEIIFKEVLSGIEKASAANSIETAESLSGLAAVLSEQSRLQEAEPLHERAVNTLVQSLGVTSPIASRALRNLGRHYFIAGQLDRSEVEYRRALQWFEASDELDHIDATSIHLALIMTLARQGKTEQALTELPRVLDTRRKQLGEDHPLNALALKVAAEVQLIAREFGKAEESVRASLVGLDRSFGADHVYYAEALYIQARIKVATERRDEALQDFRAASLIIEQVRARGELSLSEEVQIDRNGGYQIQTAHLEAIWNAYRRRGHDGALLDEGLRVAQSIQTRSTAAALSHSRTEFHDFDEPAKKRLLVRLWLRDHGKPGYVG